jgi:hypothetical protein
MHCKMGNIDNRRDAECTEQDIEKIKIHLPPRSLCDLRDFAVKKWHY